MSELLKNILYRAGAEETIDFTSDASNFTGNCDVVYFPKNRDEVTEIVKYANSRKIPITVSAARTSLTGSSVPEGGIVLNTARLNKLISIDEETWQVTLEPGYYLKDLKEFLYGKGLLYPPDPTEELSTIGGNIATNASGAKTFKYGPTRNFVEELEIILPDGEFIKLKRGANFAIGNKLTLISETGNTYNIDLGELNMPEVKNAAGYFIKSNMDAIDLFIGSEGTLGIITAARLKLINAPEELLSCLAYFENEDDALSFISDARSIAYKNRNPIPGGLPDPRALEFFDRYSLALLYEEYKHIPVRGAAVWFEQEYNSTNAECLHTAWNELMEKHHASPDSWLALNRQEQEEIGKFRHAVSYIVNEYIKRRGLRKVGTDVAVPDSEFVSFYKKITGMARDSGLKFVTYGHFGNSHIHLNMLPVNSKEYELAKELYYKICSEAVLLKGTVSAEHGIGKLKKEYLRLMYSPEEIEVMKRIKLTLDPNNILSPGNIF